MVIYKRPLVSYNMLCGPIITYSGILKVTNFDLPPPPLPFPFLFKSYTFWILTMQRYTVEQLVSVVEL